MARPYRPARELEDHLDRGELDFAIALARGISRERGRPLELELMARFLPLIAGQRPHEFDGWALRWLERWCGEQRGLASIDEALDVVQALAAVAIEDEAALQLVRQSATRTHAGGARGDRLSRKRARGER
jgi:hypothetical protein